jgi:RNA 3'-terminal phosphate cyclase (ATP)
VSGLVIDGSHGEAGGQIVRTTLALAAITGRTVRIHKIRAGRRNAGLAAQHLTGVRAIATICNARVSGDELGSQSLTFMPGGTPKAGDYTFDVAKAREGGSAGATCLVLHSVLLPLVLADGDSTVVIRGGTHVAWSPPFDYAQEVWLWALAQMGVEASLELIQWGWYPAGQGEIRVTVVGRRSDLSPLTLVERGSLRRVRGRAVAANLPAHIPQRMTDRAHSLLKGAGLDAHIEPLRVRAECAGAGIFLTAEYEGARAGFSALGAKGKPSEAVAEEAVVALLAHRDSGQALDQHLADQLVLPMALAGDASSFSVERISRHLATNKWVVEQFGLAQILVKGCRVDLQPIISDL